jgi:surface protein
MQEMFRYAKALLLNVSSFDTRNVVDMSKMFCETEVRNLDLQNFDTMNVTNMSMMFRGCKAKTILFSKNFNTTKVTDMRAMFRFSSVNDFDLTSFDTEMSTLIETLM